MYDLPSPLAMLASPLSKTSYKSMIKSRVTDYWERFLRKSAAPKDSLLYFNPDFMSLRKCHPIWTSCSANPFEVNKAICQARLLSGRYRCDWACRHWSRTNKDGFCFLCPGQSIPGTIEHCQCSVLLFGRRGPANLGELLIHGSRINEKFNIFCVIYNKIRI